MSETSDLIQLLLPVAKQSSAHAYADYSKFHVGAALLCKDGRVIPGCNVENVSFGLTNCAERTALFAAVSQGMDVKDCQAMLIYTPTAEPVSPCGACRQVIAELMDADATIISCCAGDTVKSWSVRQLLPDAFQF